MLFLGVLIILVFDILDGVLYCCLLTSRGVDCIDLHLTPTETACYLNYDGCNMTTDRIPAAKRALSNTWSLTMPLATLTLDLNTDMSTMLTQEITREIVVVLIQTLLQAQGWHYVAKQLQVWTAALTSWLIEHCCMQFRIFDDCCMFESYIDATLFQLTWG